MNIELTTLGEKKQHPTFRKNFWKIFNFYLGDLFYRKNTSNQLLFIGTPSLYSNLFV